MKIVVHICFWIILFVFFEQILRSKLGGSYGSSFFFLIFEAPPCFSIVPAPIYNQPSVQEGPFPTSSPVLAICCFVDNNHFDRYKVVFHCNFNLHLLNDEWHWASFHVSWLSVCFRKNASSGHLPIFKSSCIFLVALLSAIFIIYLVLFSWLSEHVN